MRPPGLTAEPVWARETWLPELPLLSVALVGELRAEHLRLLGEVAAAHDHVVTTLRVEAPRDPAARAVWEHSGERARNPALRAARVRAGEAWVALADHVDVVLGRLRNLGVEVAKLRRDVPIGDEARREEAARLARFVVETQDRRDMLGLPGELERVREAVRGIVAAETTPLEREITLPDADIAWAGGGPA